MKYFKEFIVGTSIFTYAIFLYGVDYFKEYRNYDYVIYSFIAPLWFGFWNAFSAFYAAKLKLSDIQRFISILFITYIASIINVNRRNAYNFNSEQWRSYYLKLFLAYIIVWSVVYLIEKLMS